MRGAVLVDTVVAIALFGVLFVGFLGFAQVGVQSLTEHKARTGALALARTHIEYIRSLEYANVGITGGNPNGVLSASSQDTLNGTSYTLTTTVNWVDDADDGTSPSDSTPEDYKQVGVTVSWLNGADADAITLSSFVADFTEE